MKKLKLAVALLALSTLGGCYETGRGEKIGIITKISKQGIFCKTWEAEIVRGGFSNGTGVNGQSFHFTIEDEATAKQITDAMEGQKEVKIHYRSEFASFCRSDSGSDFLTKVEIIEQPKAAAAVPGTSSNSTVIEQLLEVQAKLIQELAKGR